MVGDRRAAEKGRIDDHPGEDADCQEHQDHHGKYYLVFHVQTLIL